MSSSHQDKVLIVVSGPTAVGKTSLVISLAKHFGAEVFSADSRQVYKEMSVGTAKVTHSEMEGIRHHFVDHVSIHDKYDVGLYEKEVLAKLDDYYNSKNIAILSGGTGLYLKAVIEGLDEFPDLPSSLIEKIKEEVSKKGISGLQQELLESDPEYYQQVDINNPHRLIRAISVIRHTGNKFSYYRSGKAKKRTFKCVFILLDRERKELYDRINLRVDVMIKKGLIQEARNLYPYRALKALQTVGYNELFLHFDDLISLEDAIEKIKQNTRRYAKRQLTWFRRDERWKRFHPVEEEVIQDHIIEVLSHKK